MGNKKIPEYSECFIEKFKKAKKYTNDPKMAPLRFKKFGSLRRKLTAFPLDKEYNKRWEPQKRLNFKGEDSDRSGKSSAECV